jgi:lipoprotein-anchoring transpeptidase ErfK/SrfK
MVKTIILTVILLTMIGISTISADNIDSACAEDVMCETVVYGLPDTQIIAYPKPDVETLFVDVDRLNDRWYFQTTGQMEIFDAPGGLMTGVLDAGFNFVTALQKQGDWVEINSGQWATASVLDESNWIVSQFSGVLLSNELPYPLAWSLVNQYPASSPGGDPDETNALIYRYTHLNLYAAVELNGEIWYQVGVNQWVHQFNVAKVIPVARTTEIETERWISIDLYEQVVIAYEGVKPVFATLVSSGLPRWPTREGVFNIYFRRQRDDMTGGTPGDDFYHLEEVPWTMYFDEGRALHGAYWHDGFGYRRSHGCVNLSITDAHWLYQWVAEAMGSHSSADREEGPAVYVYSSGIYAD